MLRVDAATPVMLHFLMPLVKPFRERYPEMTLSLVSSETFINLIERKVDVAIRAGTLTDSSLRARPLFNSYRKIIASPDYLARHGTPKNVADLKDHLCLGFTEPVSLNTWPVSCCDGQLLEVNCEISSNSGETLSSYAWQGMVLPVCPIIWSTRKLRAGSLLNCWPRSACRLKCRSARFTTVTEPSARASGHLSTFLASM